MHIHHHVHALTSEDRTLPYLKVISLDLCRQHKVGRITRLLLVPRNSGVTQARVGVDTTQVRCRIEGLITRVLTPENHISLPHDPTQVSSAFMMFGRKASHSESECHVRRTPSLRGIEYYLIILNTKRFPIITIDYGTLINLKINY